MSYVDDLLVAYSKFVALPWQQNLAAQERVWMAIYPPEYERRVRLNIPAFQSATTKHGHGWSPIDVTTTFETWLAALEYRDTYFEDPEILNSSPAFFDHLVREVCVLVDEHAETNGVVALIGVGSLFGLGDSVKVSALISRVSGHLSGRLLVFFPGEHAGNNYRLLDARDGWNYLAIPITPNGSG